MSTDPAVTAHLHSHAALVRDGAVLADELATFFRRHHRSAGDASAVTDALYAITLRTTDGGIVGAVTVNLPADLITAAQFWAGTPRRTHVITHLAVHPDHRRAGHGRRLLAGVHVHPLTSRQQLVVAVSYAVDHADQFWNTSGYTLTRRATPAVLPADVVGLTAPDGVDGISAGNTIHPARFVYLDITNLPLLIKDTTATGLPFQLELTPTETAIGIGRGAR